MVDKEGEIRWMFCTQCKRTVVHNNSGICLRCQEKYSEETQPDSWTNMHRCKECGGHFVFMAEGCVNCTGRPASTVDGLTCYKEELTYD